CGQSPLAPISVNKSENAVPQWLQGFFCIEPQPKTDFASRRDSDFLHLWNVKVANRDVDLCSAWQRAHKKNRIEI
ncbi:MAG: hypothetical protein KKC33_08100, partial [Gammaproteobacteria bacterium]|nr:hypothetical protein [Gammaproteobacteria bacterium]